MSAFIVEDITINKIVAYLDIACRTSNRNLLAPLEKIGYTKDYWDKKECERLAKDLFQLTVDAVNARYGENHDTHSQDLHGQDRLPSGGSGLPV